MTIQSIYSELAQLEQQLNADENELFAHQFTGNIDTLTFAVCTLTVEQERELLELRKQQAYN